jgi:hypothetical protein
VKKKIILFLLLSSFFASSFFYLFLRVSTFLAVRFKGRAVTFKSYLEVIQWGGWIPTPLSSLMSAGTAAINV